MRILFVAVFNPSSTNYSQANALEKLGHTVVRYEYRERAAKIGAAARDAEIIELVKLGVDLVIFSKCDDVDHAVLDACNLVSKTCLWYMDTLVSWSSALEDKIQKASFTACAWKGPFEAAQKLSDNVYWIDEGYDSDVDMPSGKRKVFDVSFIGNPDGRRKKIIEDVGGVIISDAYGHMHPKMVGKTKINLNFTRDGGSSDRVYKVLAARGFLLTEDYPGLSDRFVAGRDLYVFTDTKELKELIEYFLKNEHMREGIANSGWKEVQKYTRLEWARKIVEAHNEVS